MDILLGMVMKRKKVLISSGIITVYKPIAYGYAKEIEDRNTYFLSGKYANKIIPIQRYDNTSEICAALFDLENFLSSGFQSIDFQIKNYYQKYWLGTYNLYDYDNRTFETITNKEILEKCRIEFGDEVDVDIIDNEENIIFDDSNSTTNNNDTENSENNFSIYQIEDKYNVLKEHVYGQDEQLKQVLASVVKNINLVDLMYLNDKIAKEKSNILLVGPTGVGKTLMIKEMAKLFNIPYVIEDATRYTGSGWAGEDIENMLRNLYIASGKNITKAETGILIVDEFDKLCGTNENANHTTTTVQQGLLKLIEGTQINISKNNHTDIGGFIFDTRKLTIILAGAFDGIDKIVEKRINERKIGFSTNQTDEQDKKIQIEDLINYGMISELAGRMSNIIVLNTPNENDLKNAFLYSKSSSLNLLKEFLKDNGITVEFDEKFIDTVVNKAITLKTGYRGLNQILNNVVENEMYDIMANKKKVLSLTSDKVK